MVLYCLKCFIFLLGYFVYLLSGFVNSIRFSSDGNDQLDKTETINSTQGNSVLVYKNSSRDSNIFVDIQIFTDTKIPFVESICCYFGKAISMQSDCNVGR